jgi:hypothetical protein
VNISGNTSVLQGANQSYVFTPTSGYRVKRVLVDSVSQGSITTYTFTNVQSNHTIQVEFEAIPTIISETPRFNFPTQEPTPTPTPSPIPSQSPTQPEPTTTNMPTPSPKTSPKTSTKTNSTPNSSEISVPDGTVVITPTQIAALNLVKSTSGSIANIAISQLKNGQRVRVTVISKQNLQSKAFELDQSQISRIDSNLSLPTEKPSQTNIQIKPVPKSAKTDINKAQISVTGLKKNQRVRVTVRSK